MLYHITCHGRYFIIPLGKRSALKYYFNILLFPVNISVTIQPKHISFINKDYVVGQFQYHKDIMSIKLAIVLMRIVIKYNQLITYNFINSSTMMAFKLFQIEK